MLKQPETKEPFANVASPCANAGGQKRDWQLELLTIIPPLGVHAWHWECSRQLHEILPVGYCALPVLDDR